MWGNNNCKRQFRKVARKLVFHGQGHHEADFTFTCSTPFVKKICGKLTRKQDTPMVDTSVRRSTAMNDGYRHKSLPDTRAPHVRRSKICWVISQTRRSVKRGNPRVHQEGREHTDKECDVPPTLIPVMQKVGLALGIEAQELTKEKFMATPDDKATPDCSND
jgi:hypothetical protein